MLDVLLRGSAYGQGENSPFEKGKDEMDAENPHEIGLKQKAAHEFKEMAIVFFYLAFFFCALATYSMVLLADFHISSSFSYGAALINALVITKVIWIGEVAHLGKRLEAKPVLYSAVYKAFMFCLLVLAFHFLEEIIKQLVHHKDIASAFHEMRFDDLFARSVIVFCTFIPFFGFRELGRVLGRDKLRSLLIRTRTTPDSD
jgi:magnesium-transporting ATPase (P-type)